MKMGLQSKRYLISGTRKGITKLYLYFAKRACEMMTRWIWLVPSYIVKSFASRYNWQRKRKQLNFNRRKTKKRKTHLLHRIFRVESCSTKDLDGVVGAFVGGFAGQRLGYGGVEAVATAHINFVTSLRKKKTRGVLKPERAGNNRANLPDCESGGLDADCHVGEKKRDRLVVADELAKGLALHGVFGGLVQAPPRQPDRSHRHSGAGPIKSTHRNLEALQKTKKKKRKKEKNKTNILILATNLADLSQHVLFGHHHIFKCDAARVAASLSQVDLFASYRDALCVRVHDKASKRRARRSGSVGASKHEVPIRHTAVSL
jgi:hypothetical protein